MHLSSVEPRPVCRPCSDPRSAKPLLLGATRCAQLCRRLIADLNPSHSPAVACHDALRNEVAIAARFRVVAAETGGGAAPPPAKPMDCRTKRSAPEAFSRLERIVSINC